MSNEQERRVAPRVGMDAPAEYRAGSGNGTGTVRDISTSGVRVDDVSMRLDNEEEAGLRCSFYMGSFGVELTGRVVRQTDTGFALQFLELGADQRALLDRLTRL